MPDDVDNTLEDCVAGLLADPNFVAAEGQSREETARTVCMVKYTEEQPSEPAILNVKTIRDKFKLKHNKDGGYSAIAIFPILAVIRWSKTAENATDYSLNNTVRQVLFLPTTREQKYKAKQAIDTFFVRVGDVMQAVLVAVGLHVFAFHTRHFAMCNIALIVIWLILAFLIGRENAKLTAAQSTSEQ